MHKQKKCVFIASAFYKSRTFLSFKSKFLKYLGPRNQIVEIPVSPIQTSDVKPFIERVVGE